LSSVAFIRRSPRPSSAAADARTPARRRFIGVVPFESVWLIIVGIVSLAERPRGCTPRIVGAHRRPRANTGVIVNDVVVVIFVVGANISNRDAARCVGRNLFGFISNPIRPHFHARARDHRER
jgi:hypothetical protein